MIIPSIDIMNGQAVQLIGGETRLDAGDPLAIAERFSRVGFIAVIDLDAALGQATTQRLSRPSVGDTGAGTAEVSAASRAPGHGSMPAPSRSSSAHAPHPSCWPSSPKAASRLWMRAMTRSSSRLANAAGERIESRMAALNPYVAGYLVTFVECEGRMSGTRMDRVRAGERRRWPQTHHRRRRHHRRGCGGAG